MAQRNDYKKNGGRGNGEPKNTEGLAKEPTYAVSTPRITAPKEVLPVPSVPLLYYGCSVDEFITFENCFIAHAAVA